MLEKLQQLSVLDELTVLGFDLCPTVNDCGIVLYGIFNGSALLVLGIYMFCSISSVTGIADERDILTHCYTSSHSTAFLVVTQHQDRKVRRSKKWDRRG